MLSYRPTTIYRIRVLTIQKFLIPPLVKHIKSLTTTSGCGFERLYVLVITELTMDIDSDKLQKIFINPTIGNRICKVIILQLFPAQHIVECSLCYSEVSICPQQHCSSSSSSSRFI